MSSKKICFLISNNFLHDNRTKRQAESLVRLGHDVTIVCPRVSADVKNEEVIDDIRVKRVLDDWLPIVPKNSEHLNECKKYLASALSEKPDLYICKDLDTLFYGWYASRKNAAKLIYNADEYWQDLTLGGLGWKTKVYYKIYFFFAERLFIHRADLVTTVNEELAEKMKQIFFLKEKPLVIMNSPEKTAIKKTSKLREDSGFENEKIAIYVGIFSEGRGLEDFIDASSYLDPEIGCVLLGYGPKKDLLEKCIIDAKLENKVKIIEAVAYDELISYISEAAVGVIPILPVSFSYEYCLPNKFFEYIQAEIPICSSDLPVLSSLINKYQIGELFASGKPDELAKAITRMLSNKEKYLKYKKNIKVAKNELNWENEEKKFVKAIAEVIS